MKSERDQLLPSFFIFVSVLCFVVRPRHSLCPKMASSPHKKNFSKLLE
jgi:hypothetical protein